MAYRFLADSTVEANLHRIMDEQLEKAIQQLRENFSTTPERAIHHTRKRLKKCRSLLRLLRKSMDKATYKQEKNALRDLGRALAPARDAEAYAETLADLLETYRRPLDMETFSELQASLADWQQSELQKLTNRDNVIPFLIAELTASQERLNRLSLKKAEWEAIEPNLLRLYSQGQERFQTAYEDQGSDQDFHAWRKRVKDLWYALRLLRLVWPPVIQATESEAHTLAQLLGDGHDIAELEVFLQHCPDSIAPKLIQLEVLTPLMHHQKQQIYQQAKSLGQKLYAEAPEAFTQRLARYWEPWFAPADCVSPPTQGYGSPQHEPIFERIA
ncbi:MAG: CHAD domain-containing protein [Leptolyngbyaceae cyanobacterium SM2_3_12]|nr:CHAD domain-containing protein [Leptolyngbyaceae cyanobacterium SM2_3_12]